jgi:Tol biopolymer transport system component
MNADGSDLQCLTPGEGQYHDPVFSPDGAQIAYVACHPFYEEIHNIHVMNQDGTEPQALTTTNMDSYPDFSRDGKYIAFVSGRDRSLEIYRMRADGNDQQRLTFVEDRPEQRVGPAPTNRSPVHAPDGESIVFVCLPLGPSQHPEHGNRYVLQPGQIHRIHCNGTGRQALVTLEGGCHDPQFSPDGTWLAFRSQSHVCLTRPDGSGLVRLRDSYGMCESFHPEGNRIVFASCRDRRFEQARRNWDLYCIDIQGGELQRLSDNEAFDNFPVFSPDGTRILFCSDRDGYTELYTMPYGE